MEQESPVRLKYGVLAENDGFSIQFLASGKLIQRVSGNDTSACEYVINLLNRIANWEHTLHLQNPASVADASQVELCFSEINSDGTRTEHEAEEITFDIVKRNGEWSDVTGQIHGRNKTGQRLHLMLVWFDEQFGINVLSNEPHEGDESSFVFQLNVANDIYEEMGFCLEDHEGNQATHTLKLFVSREKIDGFLLDQRPIEIGKTVDASGPNRARGGTFKRKRRSRKSPGSPKRARSIWSGKSPRWARQMLNWPMARFESSNIRK